MSEAILRKPPALLRWTVLIVISAAMMGNYYIYDSISPLADLLKKQIGFSDAAIGTLNAIYSFPNIFMVVIGGIIIDRIGTKKSSLLFSMFVMLGSVITCMKGNLLVMATGRLIFGLGAESMIVAITTSTARWFRGKEFALAFGINLTLARLGSFLALNSPSWAAGFYLKGWQYPLFIATSGGVMSVLCLTVYYFIDNYSVKKYDLAKEGAQSKIEFKGMLKFSKSFWLISFLCLIFYAAMFPFQTFAVKFFQHVHHISRDAAGFLSSILFLSAMIFTPLFGWFSDLIGKRSLLMVLGSILIIPVYLLMGYNANLVGLLGLPNIIHIKFSLLSINNYVSPNLLIPMSIMGLAFSLIPAIMWPAVALVVEPHRLGTAYGLMTMIQNVGLFGFNLLIGFANDIFHAGEFNPNGYIPGMWIFSLCGISGLFISILLNRNTKKSEAINLDKPMKDIH